MVSIRSPIFNFSSLLFNPLGTVLSAPIKFDITVTLMFHSFLSFLARSKYLSFFSLSLIFTLWSTGTVKSSKQQVLFLHYIFFLVIVTRSGLIAGISRSVSISKSQRILCLILYDRFCFVYVPFSSIVKFQFFA